MKPFSCLSQLSRKFQRLTITKLFEIKNFLAFKLSDVVFIMLINVKMPTVVSMIVPTFDFTTWLDYVSEGMLLLVVQ